MKGAEEGEWTYTGGCGESMIDYTMGDERTRESIEKMVVVWIKDRKKGGETEGKRKKGKCKGIWMEEGMEEFRNRIGI